MRISHVLALSTLALSTLALAACSPPPPSGPGGPCDPANAASCETDLVCEADTSGANTCQIPLGETCDPAAETAHCADGGTCVETVETVDGVETTTGYCYLPEGAACDPEAEVQCDPALSCAEHEDGAYLCRRPLLFRGRVLDATDDSAIALAHVIGLDEQPVAQTDIAISAVDGTYELRVPVLRNAEGAPVATNFTLRGSADGYQTFPGGIRTAIPISSTLAVDMEDGWVVTGTLTDVVLIPIADPTIARVSISGHVVAEDQEAGVLVVANGADAGYSAISAADGAYTIFNVPAGTYEVRGYASGLQLTPVSVTTAAADLVDVDLLVSTNPLSTISGTMQIVNPGDCTATSVVLAVESTFDEIVGRGELPPGVRAPTPPEAPSILNGAMWAIDDVPDGRYVVLAAFENDECVRDPDTSIAGTAILHISLPEDAGALGATFKITGALPVIAPGVDEPEAVTTAPTLTWEDDAGEADYLVEVFDAYGDLVWMQVIPGVSGSSMVTLPYGGPLDSGMYYQFRATSRNGSETPLSRTEDLRGVFYVP